MQRLMHRRASILFALRSLPLGPFRAPLPSPNNDVPVMRATAGARWLSTAAQLNYYPQGNFGGGGHVFNEGEAESEFRGDQNPNLRQGEGEGERPNLGGDYGESLGGGVQVMQSSNQRYGGFQRTRPDVVSGNSHGFYHQVNAEHIYGGYRGGQDSCVDMDAGFPGKKNFASVPELRQRSDLGGEYTETVSRAGGGFQNLYHSRKEFQGDMAEANAGAFYSDARGFGHRGSSGQSAGHFGSGQVSFGEPPANSHDSYVSNQHHNFHGPQNEKIPILEREQGQMSGDRLSWPGNNNETSHQVSQGFIQQRLEIGGNGSSAKPQSLHQSGRNSLPADMWSGFPGVGSSTIESAESDRTNSLIGTIEELDDFCSKGKVKESVEILGLLEKNGVIVDRSRYLQLMQIFNDSNFIEEARVLHRHISNTFGNEVGLSNKILNMYFNCGATEDASLLFENMPQRNLTSWDNMIRGLAENGLGEDALNMFTKFKEMGLKPDGDIFLSVLFACASIDEIEEGMLHFKSMKDFGIAPTMEHYASVVKMLGGTGYLDEALEFIEQMPVEPNVDVWEAMMNMSRTNGNLELGNRCAEIVERLDSSRLDDNAKKGLLPVNAAELVKEKQKNKETLMSIRSHSHEFKAGDKSQPEVYVVLRRLAPQMREAGYVPELKCVLHDVDNETKEEALLAHSERLALAHGLLTSAPRADIRIIKNLRCCADCHNAFKIISKLIGRKIISRDAKRFHHFENGVCSCRDYW